MDKSNYSQTSTTSQPGIGLFRRLFAIFYDCFLLLAILFVVSGIATTLNQGVAVEPGNTLYPLMVFIIFSLSYLYFAWFWMHGGQTLGMKTWQMQLRTLDNSEIDRKITVIRFITAVFSWGFVGLGFLWTFIDKQNRCWHDLSSKTIMVDLRKY